VTYENGWTRNIQLAQYGSADVVVDPWLNGGQPTLAQRGVRVVDIVSRLKAKEPARDVADDYGLLDRGLGSRIVPQALRQAGWTLETMDERYGPSSYDLRRVKLAYSPD
jgi:uncharacterized protein (DUF433 family)